jgi:hypothetical protein
MIYDIMRDGDRSLKGKIAELVFERVRSSLVRRTLYCCSTTRLSSFLTTNPPTSSTNVSSLIHDYATKLNLVRKILGMEVLDVSTALSYREVRENLKGLCFFCLNKDENKTLFIERGGHERVFFACKDCFSKCLERGLLWPTTVEFFYPFSGTGPIRVTKYFVADSIISEDKTFHELVWGLVEALDLLKNLDVIEVLSRLDAQARDFLRELYGKRLPGQHLFDYVCVDDQGGRYLVDVTSVRGIDASPAPLSKREREVAVMAKGEGFKVLVPVVRFLSDWRVLIELVEV